MAVVTPRVLAVVGEGLRGEFFTAEARARLDALGTVFASSLDEALSRARPTGERGGDAPTGDALDLGSVEVLITSWGVGPLDDAALDRLPSLRLVAHTGASVKPFVTDELFARGIRVTQAGAAMARSVAEVALGFTLALLHRMPRFDHALHAGADWAAAEQAPAQHELLHAPIGVIGASRTGRAYLELVRLLGGRVLLADPTLDDAEARGLGAELVSLDELLRRSRIVALHAPSLPETRHLLGAREFAAMPDGAGFVNTARSWMVDEPALIAELRSGRLDAAIDVFDEEPLPVDHPFRGLPNVLLVPHKAAGTHEGRLRQGALVVEEVERFVAGMPLQHAVTAAELDRMA